MDRLAILLRNAVENAEFRFTPSRPVSAETLRSDFVAGERLRIYPKAVCRGDALAPLVAYLKKQLMPYINEDVEEQCGLVGYGVDYVRGFVTRRSVQNIALLLVRAAALLTPSPAAAIFSGWLGGKPVLYKMVGLVDGASAEKGLALEVGINVKNASRWQSPIPDSVVISRLPDDLRAGSAEVSFEVRARPMLFRYEDPAAPRGRAGSPNRVVFRRGFQLPARGRSPCLRHRFGALHGGAALSSDGPDRTRMYSEPKRCGAM